MDDPSDHSVLSQLKNTISVSINPNKHEGVDSLEIELLSNLEKFFQTTAKEVMIPRTKMVTLDISQKLDEAAKLFFQTGFSRLPIQDKKRDNIVGILHAIDLLQFYNSTTNHSIARLIRKPFFISYSLPIHQLISEFQKTNTHLALVIDEHGGVDGLITLGDVVEELVGEIPSENSKDAEPEYEMVEDGLIIMDANLDIDLFNELYGSNFNKEGIETIGGYICHYLGEIPKKGDSFKIESIPFTIEESCERNLIKLKLIAPENLDQ